MELEKWVIIILGFLVFGLLASLIYTSIRGLDSFSPSQEEVLSTELQNLCQSKLNVYVFATNEVNRKSFCCASIDLNNNNIIESDEYCAKACKNCNFEGKNVKTLCQEPINYYNNPDSCLN